MDKYEVFIPEGQKSIGQLRVRRLIDGLDEAKAWDVTVSRHRAKRSLTANAYAWKLIDLIASQLHESKEDIYRGYVQNVGGNSEYMSVKDEAIPRLHRIWDVRGIGWGIKILGASAQEGMTDIEMYYGSSAFDTRQMARLIDLIVQDCIALDIPTKDPAELEQLVKEWGIE